MLWHFMFIILGAREISQHCYWTWWPPQVMHDPEVHDQWLEACAQGAVQCWGLNLGFCICSFNKYFMERQEQPQGE